MLSPLEIATNAAKALDEKKGKELKILKVEQLTTLANYFVICTASSSTHIKTLSDEIEKELELLGEPVRRKEGLRSGGWVLLDYGCVVVHIFLEEIREFYNLERLWADGQEIAFG